MAPTSSFLELYGQFPAEEMPFLQRANRRLRETRPYDGLTIRHHVPITLETVLKLEPLILGGACLSVSNPSFVAPDPKAVDLLRRNGIHVTDGSVAIGEVDVALDCGGELLARVRPRLGACELTGTGTARYRRERLDYPVIAVDECRVKDLESLLGTGEAFVRAFRQLVEPPISLKPFIIVGYGKVGKGIARALRPYTDAVSIVDADSGALAAAKRAGYDAVHADDAAAVEHRARHAFAVVTATGTANVISDRYDPAAFRGRYLANMGGEDEFGPGFAAAEVLHDKQPMNFAVSAPTLMRYLDPVFHAHNLGVDLLRFARLEPGVHSFPDFLAEDIVDEWQHRFGQRLDDE